MINVDVQDKVHEKSSQEVCDDVNNVGEGVHHGVYKYVHVDVNDVDGRYKIKG